MGFGRATTQNRGQDKGPCECLLFLIFLPIIIVVGLIYLLFLLVQFIYKKCTEDSSANAPNTAAATTKPVPAVPSAPAAVPSAPAAVPSAPAQPAPPSSSIPYGPPTNKVVETTETDPPPNSDPYSHSDPYSQLQSYPSAIVQIEEEPDGGGTVYHV